MEEIEQDKGGTKKTTSRMEPVDPWVVRCMQMPLVTFAFGQ